MTRWKKVNVGGRFSEPGDILCHTEVSADMVLQKLAEREAAGLPCPYGRQKSLENFAKAMLYWVVREDTSPEVNEFGPITP